MEKENKIIINNGKKSSNRLNLPEREILDLYNNKNIPISKIAKLMNCDFCVIKRILKENNIKIKPTNFYTKGRVAYNKIIKDEQEVIDMYTNQNFPGTKIAEHFNCDNSVIYGILNKNNIKIKGNSHFLAGKISPMKGKTYEEMYGENSGKIRKKVSEATIKVMENPQHREKLSKIRKEGIKEGRIIIPKGREHPLYNKTYEEIYGKEKANQKKENMRLSSMGKYVSEKTKIKASATKQGIPLEQWKGFTSFEPYTSEFNKKLKKAIKERDGCCMLCNVGFEDLKLLKRQINIHHINYDKKCNLPQNLIILCNSCHGITNRNRQHWTKFFQSLLTERYGYQYSEGNIILNLNEDMQ